MRPNRWRSLSNEVLSKALALPKREEGPDGALVATRYEALFRHEEDLEINESRAGATQEIGIIRIVLEESARDEHTR